MSRALTERFICQKFDFSWSLVQNEIILMRINIFEAGANPEIPKRGEGGSTNQQ